MLWSLTVYEKMAEWKTPTALFYSTFLLLTYSKGLFLFTFCVDLCYTVTVFSFLWSFIFVSLIIVGLMLINTFQYDNIVFWINVLWRFKCTSFMSGWIMIFFLVFSFFWWRRRRRSACARSVNLLSASPFLQQAAVLPRRRRRREIRLLTRK